MILAIDTSSSRSGLALCDGERLLAEQTWHSGRRHSEQLLPQLDALCRLVDVTPAQIRTVAVSLGPGSWSGIRVGISIAKGLALATDAAIIGITALDALAWPFRGQAGCAALSLGRGRYAVGCYPAAAWHPGSCAAVNTDSLPDSGTLWVDADADMPPHPDTATLVQQWPRALAYAQIAHWLIAHEAVPTGALEPVYLGDPVQRHA